MTMRSRRSKHLVSAVTASPSGPGNRDWRKGRPWVVATSLVLTLAAAAAAVAAVAGYHFGQSPQTMADRLALAGVVLAAASFVLVAVAGAVALLAYLVASGAPDLEIQLRFRSSAINAPVFQAESPADLLGRRVAAAWRQTEGHVVLWNRSRYAARNPGVRLELIGLGGLDEQPGWTVIASANQVGPTWFQWDGGVDGVVHGEWSRTLPGLDFSGLAAYPNQPTLLRVTVAADGMSPQVVDMPVRMLAGDEWTAYTDERNSTFPPPLQAAPQPASVEPAAPAPVAGSPADPAHGPTAAATQAASLEASPGRRRRWHRRSPR